MLEYMFKMSLVDLPPEILCEIYSRLSNQEVLRIYMCHFKLYVDLPIRELSLRREKVYGVEPKYACDYLDDCDLVEGCLYLIDKVIVHGTDDDKDTLPQFLPHAYRLSDDVYLTLLKRLHFAGLNIHINDEEHLFEAIECEYLESVKFLLANGANVYAETYRHDLYQRDPKSTVLDVAIEQGYSEILIECLKYMSSEDVAYMSCINSALDMSECSETAGVLLDAGGDINRIDNTSDMTRLNDYDVIGYHKQHNDVYTTNWLSIYAAVNDRMDVVEYLTSGIDYTQLSIPNTTEQNDPLSAAALYGSYEVVKYINERLLECEETQLRLDHALNAAARSGHLRIVSYLHLSDASITKYTVLEAAKLGHVEVVMYLHLNCPAGTREDEDIALCEAAKMDLATVRYLVETGSYIHARQHDAFYNAIYHGQISILKYLLYIAEKIGEYTLKELVSRCDERFLHVALCGRHKEMVDYVISLGADTTDFEDRLHDLRSNKYVRYNLHGPC